MPKRSPPKAKVSKDVATGRLIPVQGSRAVTTGPQGGEPSPAGEPSGFPKMPSSGAADTADAHVAIAGVPGPITIEVNIRLQAVAIPDSDGGFSIVVPALPGCVTEADSLEQVQASVVEAAELWLDVAHERNREERFGGALG